MEIQLNGCRKVIDCLTVSELIQADKLDPASLIVEVNRQIIKQENWSAAKLKEGDQVELLSFVGGG